MKNSKLLIALVIIVITLPVLFAFMTSLYNKPTKTRIQVGLTDKELDSLLNK
ncbi:hypothetical protein [Solitalea lacus]|uniref:hypothetical protein n=1 Tax=Solitalea lacus TaxID=2911172 RepID=UPI001EDA328E|nr:hypothetical protein [Solitalea lacus]UKJ06816.1 hypothetical protein L2B55_14915 [Solitalea lacus]